MQMDDGRRSRVIVLGGLVVTWFLPEILPAVLPEKGEEGFTTRTIVMLGFMGAYAGAATWVLAPGHRRLGWGVLAGFLMIVTWALASLTVQTATGTLELAEGETPFSTLIELPFWLTLVGVPCAFVGGIGWIVARGIAEVSAKRFAH
jgi:hypothetical protein